MLGCLIAFMTLSKMMVGLAFVPLLPLLVLLARGRWLTRLGSLLASLAAVVVLAGPWFVWNKLFIDQLTAVRGSELQLPPPSEFLDALRERRLVLQRCDACGRLRYPVAPVCPYCGGEAFDWDELTGRGTVHSWARYRRSYLPEFEPLLPYAVLSVELEEGARIYGRFADEGEPEIGLAVQAIVERWPGGQCVHAFVRAV